jgi:putative addiction module killer protein
MEIRQTERFTAWMRGLRDRQAKARINARVRRLSLGNAGDVKLIGGGVWELRIDYGPGYRVYFLRRHEAVTILLAGGDKRSQDDDIRAAITYAREF